MLVELTRALVLSLLFAGCATDSAQRSVAPPPKPDATLGPGDEFTVFVYDQKDLSGKYRVGQDGSINFPLLGWIKVAGKDQTEIAKLLQDELRGRKLIRSPHVSVLVTGMESKSITVVGSVQKPGSFPHTRGMTIVHAISLAGGFKSIADRNETILTRQAGGKVVRVKIAVERVTEGREDDVVLQVGDTIYVPERIF